MSNTEPTKTPGINSGSHEAQAVPFTYKTSAVILIQSCSTKVLSVIGERINLHKRENIHCNLRYFDKQVCDDDPRICVAMTSTYVVYSYLYLYTADHICSLHYINLRQFKQVLTYSFSKIQQSLSDFLFEICTVNWLGFPSTGFRLCLWCVTPFSTIFQLYRGSQFYWWRKPPTCRKSLTNCIT